MPICLTQFKDLVQAPDNIINFASSLFLSPRQYVKANENQIVFIRKEEWGEEVFFHQEEWNPCQDKQQCLTLVAKADRILRTQQDNISWNDILDHAELDRNWYSLPNKVLCGLAIMVLSHYISIMETVHSK